jgi:CDP-4-dehydro-6-deoxyglucose reductase
MLEASPDLGSTLVYACGSDAMIHSAQARLEGLGLPSGHFHSDAFVCSAAT